jgi:hypothetical protein
MLGRPRPVDVNRGTISPRGSTRQICFARSSLEKYEGHCMSRPSVNRLKGYLLALVLVYVALVELVWPQVAGATSMPWKAVLALVMAAPLIACIWVVGLRVMRGDELEQRVHLLSLSVATGVVAAVSTAGGFLVAAGVFRVDSGETLLGVFPALGLSYALARLLIARLYGGTGCA